MMTNEIFTVDEHGKQKVDKLLDKLRGWALQPVPSRGENSKAGYLELLQKHHELLWTKNTVDRILGLFYRKNSIGIADQQTPNEVLGIWTECDDSDDRAALEIIAAKFLITRHRVTKREIKAYDDDWQRRERNKKK